MPQYADRRVTPALGFADGRCLGQIAPIQTIFLSRGSVRDEEFDSPERLI
jgi:hypothetical protein